MECYCDSTYHPNGECMGIPSVGRRLDFQRIEAEYQRAKANTGPFEVYDSSGKVLLVGTLGECNLYRGRAEQASGFRLHFHVRESRV